MEVLDLINETFLERKESSGFDVPESYNSQQMMLETAFLRGNCYQYAMILHKLFPNSKLGKGKLRPRDTRPILRDADPVEPKSDNHVVAFIRVTDIDDYAAFDVKGPLGAFQEDYVAYEDYEDFAFIDVDVLKGDLDKQRETQEIIKRVLEKVQEKIEKEQKTKS